MTHAPEPFQIAVADDVLDDLRHRLQHTRWGSDVGNEDWRYGVGSAYLKELVAHWLDGYDWREVEAEINAVPQFKVEIDGLPIHYVHVKGKGPDPMPLILTHGWPWTFWDFHKVIGPLTDPAAHGGDPANSFDVVIPSLPGFGFSMPLPRTGVSFMEHADLWDRLMREVLGYERYAGYGGDWGSLVTAQIGHKFADHLIGVHLGVSVPMNLFQVGLPTEEQYADHEKDRFHHTAHRMGTVGTSHMVVQADDPQTLGYGLNDSPVGLLAWILERRVHWSDSEGDPERRFTKDDHLTTAMIYWITESISTSMRVYWEAQRSEWVPSHDRSPVVEAPTAITLWPQELMLMPDAMMEDFHDLRRLTPMASGGHFHPMEEPVLLVDDLRAFFATLR
jgi:pimeloyl-ACP methyl ester carboxylesterase